MKRGISALLTALGMAALVAGGCANKEVVKSEEQPAATAKPEAPKTEPVRPAAPATPALPETTPVPEPPKVEESQASKAEVPAAVLETVFFDFDRSDLRKDSREVLNKNAELILKSGDAKVRIEGHCDERGSAEYNLALGERRAKSVQQYLITLGVAADRLSVISYGKEKPTVEGHDEAAWAKNRRAEFFIVK